jgi:uncharacterized protein YbbC (DUF1343 family)
MKTGIDCLLEDQALKKQLKTRRVALLAHPASMNETFIHSLDALMLGGISLSAAFGPQHGMRGDKQDNMVETDHAVDSDYGIPVFSLYGKTRRPTQPMLDTFDVLLVDIQDVGCRIYTFLTTLFYLLEDCAAAGKSLWVLDRPNPAGRPIEGAILQAGHESFVGAGPVPMRHGLTLGEAARWFVAHKNLDIELKVVAMRGYDPTQGPGFGWPLNEWCWVNPSPNIATLNAARAYAGTVLLEGTTLSEGRGTTRPLEMVGAPDIDVKAILTQMHEAAPRWLTGCRIRRCWFEPTFHKHVGRLCDGFQLHTDYPGYDPQGFRPYRIIALFLKTVRRLYPDYQIWRDFPYEYVTDRLAIDVIDGGTGLRQWVDEPQAECGDLERWLVEDETGWEEESRKFHLYQY